MNTLLIWITVVGLAASLLFSTLSYALRMMSRVKLEERLARRDRVAALEQILAAQHDLSLASSTLRLVSNAVVIISIAYYFQLRYQNAHPLKIYGFAVLISVPALLITSVAIPQAWAKYAGEALIASSWWLLRIVSTLLFPLVAVMNIFDEIIRRLAGVSLADDGDSDEQAEQEIMAAVNEGEAEGTVDEEQKKMIEGVISFRDLQVGQIMTPRTDIVAVDVSAPLAEVRDKVLKEGLSRVPVFEGTLDNVVGVLYAKDLLKFLDPRNAAGSASDAPPVPPMDLRKIMRPPLFVPATKPLRDLLREMKLQQVHLAVVLDEYGGTAGLVTTEDIVEEIVGDIADEYERPEPSELRRISERVIEVDARMNIAELNRELALDLPENQDYNTIGGFVISMLGSIPAKGETLSAHGVSITVLESEPRRVKKLRFDLPDPAQPQDVSGAEAAPAN